MSNMNDTIELVVPLKAEYVSVVRLTSSGIASRLGFDIETVEDIKVAVAEVCNKLVSGGSQTAYCYKITFEMSQDILRIKFYCDDMSLKCLFDESNDALSVSIIKAFMDEVEFCPESTYLLSMSKTIEGIN